MSQSDRPAEFKVIACQSDHPSRKTQENAQSDRKVIGKVITRSLWLTVAEIAEETGLGLRRLRLKAKSWEGGRVRVGTHATEYQVEGLPTEIREKMALDCAQPSEEMGGQDAHPTGEPTPEMSQLVEVLTSSPIAASKLELRAEMLGAFEIFVAQCVAEGGKATACWARFVSDYNAGKVPNLSEALLQKYPPGKCPSTSCLTSWRTKRKEGTVLALQDGYKPRLGLIRGNPEIRAELEGAISYHGIAASPKLVWNVLQKIGDVPGVKDVSPHQVQRYFEYLQDKQPAYWKQLTDPKGARNSVTPAFGNRSQDLQPNDLWELDFTRNDVVLNYKGTRKRYAQGAVIDVATRRVMMLVSDVPKGEVTALLILQAIQKFGKPKVIKPDNGKEFINTRVKALCAALEIELRPCVPGKPMEKPHIERFFGTFNRDVLPSLPSFVGASVAQRQAIREQKGEEQLFELAMEFNQFQDWVNQWINDYHAREHSTLGCSPLEKLAGFTASGWMKTVVNAKPETLALLALPRRLCTVGREGLRINNRLYINDSGLLADRIGEKRMVLFDPTQPGRVWVFSEDLKEFVCEAQWDSTFTAEELIKVTAQAGAVARAATEGVKAAKKRSKQMVQKVQKNPEVLLHGVEALGLERSGEAFSNSVMEALTSAALSQPEPEQPRNEIRRKEVDREIQTFRDKAAAAEVAYEVGTPTEAEWEKAYRRKPFDSLSEIDQARYRRYVTLNPACVNDLDEPRMWGLPHDLQDLLSVQSQKKVFTWACEKREWLKEEVLMRFPKLREPEETVDLEGIW